MAEEPFFGENIREAITTFKNMGKKAFIPPCIEKMHSIWSCEAGWGNVTENNVTSCHDKPENCPYYNNHKKEDKMRLRTIFTTIALAFLLGFMIVSFTGCAGMPKFFTPNEPYCTEVEQVDSLIYSYINPADTKFMLMIGLAATLDKHPGMAPKIKKALLALKATVTEGITYSALLEIMKEKFGVLTLVVISEGLENFKGVNIPLKVCDKRLAIGAIDKLIGVTDTVK